MQVIYPTCYFMPGRMNYPKDKSLNRCSSVLESPPYPELHPKYCKKKKVGGGREKEGREKGGRKEEWVGLGKGKERKEENEGR